MCFGLQSRTKYDPGKMFAKYKGENIERVFRDAFAKTVSGGRLSPTRHRTNQKEENEKKIILHVFDSKEILGRIASSVELFFVF